MKKCSQCGRECKVLTRGMCDKHYNQFKKYRKCLDTNPRTRFDSNEIIKHEDYAEIILYDKKCNEKARAIIDLDDIAICKQYKWKENGHGYAYCTTEKIFLHRLVMGLPEKKKVIDHINHNTLDNRKSNLRICTIQQNGFNQSLSNINSSGVKGVNFHKASGKWRAFIKYNRKNIHLGLFENKEEAIEIRKRAEIKYFGEYRYQG